MTEDPSLDSTAIHEAGHAVCALKLGVSFDKVTVKPDGDTLGACHLNDRFDVGKRRTNATKAIMIAMAGMVAQVHYGDNPIEATDSGDEDWRDAVAYVEEVFAENPEHQFDRIVGHTFGLLTRPETWKIVERVAATLILRKTLTFDEVIDVAIAALKNEPWSEEEGGATK